MTFEIRLAITFLASFLAALFVLPRLCVVAQKIGLVDKPNARKIHTEPRPLVGGIGFVISATFSALLFLPLDGFRGYFAGLAILLLVGFFDDFLEVGHKRKFLAQIISTSLLMYLSKISLSNFGDLLGFGNLVVPDEILAVWAVTVFCVVGVTNAINMIDGLDGLAGGISFLVFVTFALLSFLGSYDSLLLLNLALAGGVLGFLRYNWSPARLFMGDAGSLCLGFSLSFMAIALTQQVDSPVKPVIVLVILTVPISDTITVMTRRIVAGKSPFKPDKTHLHHTLIEAGLETGRVINLLMVICLCYCLLGLLGVWLKLPEPLLFGLFLVHFVLNCLSSKWIPVLVKK